MTPVMEELKKDSNHLTRLEANRGAGAVFASPPGVVSSGAEAQLLFMEIVPKF